MIMTNEEARERLEDWSPWQDIGDYDRFREALDMAIKALEQQPCEDCVSREALINEMKLGYFNKDLQEGKNDPCVIDAMIDWAIRLVKRKPSVTPQTRWVPVSEKPQEGRYLCTYEHYDGKCIDFGSFDGEAWYIKPIAYMPLPNPYAESEDKTCKDCYYNDGEVHAECVICKAESEDKE